MLCVAVPAEAQNSIAAYEETVRRQPTSDMAHYCLANALFKAGQVKEAMGEYQQAYSLTRSEQMKDFCKQILLHNGINLVGNKSAAGRTVRAPWLPAPTTDALERFHSMAQSGRERNRSTDSDPNGVILYSNPMGHEFDSWIAEFRIHFENGLAAILRSRGYASMAGTTKVVFSADKQHRLRSHIVETSAPLAMSDCVLATTRMLDGRSVLDFPPSTNSDGVNFSMTWNFPGGGNVGGTLTSNNVGARVMQQGASGRAGIMEYNHVNGNLHAKDAHGQLMSKQGSGQLSPGSRAGVAGGLSGGSVTISTDVAGLLLPKPKPKPKQVELKAKPAFKLEDGSKSR
jgi:hypothetical protein